MQYFLQGTLFTMSFSNDYRSSPQSLVPSPNSVTNPEQRSADRVQSFINHLLETTIDEITKPNGRPAIQLKRRSSCGDYFIDPSNRALEASGKETAVTYSWPGKNAYEAWRFSKEPSLS